jgi:Flp pilus assembly protein TadD
VSQIKADQLKLIDVRAAWLRVLLLLPIALVVFGSWRAGRWYVGDVIADYAPNLETGAIETAQMTTTLAPDDPLTYWTVATLQKQLLPPERVQETLIGFEKAVSLSPNDYRLWMDLGRTREQAGDAAGGEKALRRAVELAPAYTEPRWFLGNLLLRAGRTDDAFVELQRAGEFEPALRPQIFNMAGHIFGQDVQAISRAVGQSPAARADLAAYLVSQGHLDDALGQWNTLSAAEKLEQTVAGKTLMTATLGAKRLRAAFRIYKDINAPGAAELKEEQLVNGGFEDNISFTTENPFDWHVQSVPQAQVGIDERYRRSGNRGLRVRFQAPASVISNNLSQLVMVEPSTSYRLEYYVRTSELESAAMPFISIHDGADATMLASSTPLAVGTNEWRLVTIDFKTTPKTEAIYIVTNREACPSEAGAATATACPIFGIVWYDDFNLQRSGGNAATAGAGTEGRRAHAADASDRRAR